MARERFRNMFSDNAKHEYLDSLVELSSANLVVM